MKLLIKTILVLSIVLVLVGGSGIFYLTRGLEKMIGLDIKSIDTSLLEDGVYKGKFDYGRWTNELSIKIKDHRITNIEVVRDVRFAKPEVSKELFQRVIEMQNTTVNAVSGATVTSKAYLKSIEHALSK